MTQRNRVVAKTLTTLFLILIVVAPVAAQDGFSLKKGDHVVYIGNTMADRMQHHAWLETYLHALYPSHNLTFRNLGFSGDELKSRQRSANFGSPDEWITKCKADVIFCFFGYNEALKGQDALSGFEKDLSETIDAMRAQKYNGKSAPRLVFFSPIAHEDLKSPHLPDGSANNAKLEIYTDAMKRVCDEKGAGFVDLFRSTKELYASAEKPLTMNGIHLLDHGNRAVADVIMKKLFGGMSHGKSDMEIARLRDAVLDKNYHWFSRYRVVDGYNVFGGRSRLAWDGVSNADVMRREMEMFDTMTENRDKGVWAVAQGGEYKIKDDNLGEEIKVVANNQSKNQKKLGDYLDGDDAIEKMTIAEGMEVNLFADEKQFPRLINPVQIAVDTDSRLWASVWPSYPHWNPTEKPMDALVILPDEDNDGKADECIVFADGLNSITGFEFWNDGVLVFAPPEIWYLKDTDGDDKADHKVRMLQGISSADTHHSANAVVVGPDGWLYWSRGIFNVAAFETPTKTFRTGASGVHRFNPRTFETEFHFPIGPNPHGDVFDQWGYQFANDGTSGTGSYVNIGKGVGNKKWFQKRVRPVPATGILSSSHFPPENQGNFLICNSIGFLGVLQHEVQYDGADITATEIEPILVSSDPNFRPTDVEIGGDGALYVSDWCNTLIGHMQHNMRDPNRDHEHGRIYRVTAKGRDTIKPVKMKGKPIAEVCENFFSKTNAVRYRARLELSGRSADEIKKEVGAFADRLNPGAAGGDRDEAQAMLECLWVFEEHRIPNMEILKRVFLFSEEPRVKAAAIRTLGHWAGRVDKWEDLLVQAARSDSALVRAEAVKAAVDLKGLTAAEVIFETATRATDPGLDSVLAFAKKNIDVDSIVQDAVKSGKPLSQAAQLYVLRNAKVDDLLKMDRTEAVCRAILSRSNANAEQLGVALAGLAKLTKTDDIRLLMDLVAERESRDGDLTGVSTILLRQPAAKLSSVREELKKLATAGKTNESKQVGFASWITSEGSINNALALAVKNKESLRNLLEAVPQIADAKVREGVFDKIRSLQFELPMNLKAEDETGSLETAGIQVDFFQPHKDADLKSYVKVKPKTTGIAKTITIDAVPELPARDRFTLRFTGNIRVDRTGDYTFFTNSDDGSRLYINDKVVVNNDGNHGPVERSGKVKLNAGSHSIAVVYFDSGGGDALVVSWQGPDIKKQAIPADRLSVNTGKATIHDLAIDTIQSIPGHEAEKFADLAKAIKSGKHITSAVSAMSNIPQDNWDEKEIPALAEKLATHVSEIPAKYRTSKSALQAMQLGDQLAAKLPKDQARILRSKIASLKVDVIRIGTVAHRMIYDKERIAIQAGKPVEFIFTNTDNMPHNFAIVKPGTLEAVGELAEATARDKDAIERQYVPKTDNVLLASRMLQPKEVQALAYDAPKEPGIYPYVCTYPGHYRRMYGALYVVADLKAYLSNPDAYLASNPLPLKDELLKYNERNTEWKFETLAESIKPLPMGRNFDVSKNLFKVANCVACHHMNGEGQKFGPDLTKLEPKKSTTEHILQSILDPSKEIDKKYQSYNFVLLNGKVITGMIVEDKGGELKVLNDPLGKAPPIVIKKSNIDEQIKSPNSIMPKGLLNRLSREEILDLLAYIYAKGDKKNMLFMDHHH